MCGRYTNRLTWSDIFAFYRLTAPRDALNLRPRYNVATTQDAPVVRLAPEGRELALLRWGLVPRWAKDTKIAYSTINARVETVESKPAFRDAFQKRRCLVVADGFYEWPARGTGTKQPWLFTMKDNGPFAFAGLWGAWEGGEEQIESFTIIVGPPNDLVRPVHDHMPAIVWPADYDAWLTGAGGKELLGPYSAEEMAAQPVSTRVNSPKNDDPGCVEPVTAAA
jgi:putative SOS response-associated peptidase YedK